jgi:hypothetical protein
MEAPLTISFGIFWAFYLHFSHGSTSESMKSRKICNPNADEIHSRVTTETPTFLFGIFLVLTTFLLSLVEFEH